LHWSTATLHQLWLPPSAASFNDLDASYCLRHPWSSPPAPCSSQRERRRIHEHASTCQKDSTFLIPAIGCPSEHINQPQVCINSYLSLLSIGRDAKATLNGHAKRNTSVVDWRCGGASNNAMKPEQTDHLHSYFKSLLEMVAPRATQFVRMEVGGLETRDDDVDLLELPSYLCLQGGST
jgi:hypothetical protein